MVTKLSNAENQTSNGKSKKKKTFSQETKELILKKVQEKRDKGKTIPEACDEVRKELKVEFSNVTYNVWCGAAKGNDYLKKSRQKKRLMVQKQQEQEVSLIPDFPGSSPKTMPPALFHDGDGHNNNNGNNIVKAMVDGILFEGSSEDVVRAVKKYRQSN